MLETWAPMGADKKTYAVLHEGIPGWMSSPLWDWIGMTTKYEDRYDYPSCKEKFQRLDFALRETPTVDIIFGVHGFQMLKSMGDADFVLRMVDFFIVDNLAEGDPEDNEALETILHKSGSAWRVGQRDGCAGLERRVPLGVQEAADDVMSSSGAAGQLLSEAWHAAFGRNPDAEEAYEKAIKAVEEAGVELVSPDNRRATLGTMARDMAAQGDWKLALTQSETSPSDDVVYKMVRALWEGQESRHGGNGYRRPTEAEAEAAVFLAVPLVQWFTTNAVTRASEDLAQGA